MNAHLEPDLHAAAFLLTKGFALLGLERVGRKFAFEFSPDAQPAATEYRMGGTVVARDYAAAITRLKNELFAMKFTESRPGTENETGENSGHQVRNPRS